MDERYGRVLTPGLKPERLIRWQMEHSPVDSPRYAYYAAQLELSRLKRNLRNLTKNDPTLRELNELKDKLEAQLREIQLDNTIDIAEKRVKIAEIKQSMKTVNMAIRNRRDDLENEKVSQYDNIQKYYFESHDAINEAKSVDVKKITLRGIRKRWQEGEFEPSKGEKESESDAKEKSDSKADLRDKPKKGETPKKDETPKEKSKKDASEMSKEEIQEEIQKIKDKMISLEDYEAAKALLTKVAELDARLETPREKIELYEKSGESASELEALKQKKEQIEKKITERLGKLADFDSKDENLMKKHLEQAELLKQKTLKENEIAKAGKDGKKDSDPEVVKLKDELAEIQAKIDPIDKELSSYFGCDKKEIKSKFEELKLLDKYNAILKGMKREEKATLKEILDEVKRVKDNFEKERAQIDKKISDKEAEIASSTGKIPSKEEYESAKAVVDYLEEEIASVSDEERGWDITEAQRVYDAYRKYHPEVSEAEPSLDDDTEPKKPLSLDDLRRSGMTEDDIKAVLKGIGREAEYTPPVGP